MFNSIRQNLRAFLRIPENITAGLPTISASLPTATLGGHPPEVSFTRPAPVAPVAPVAAAAPRFRRSPVDGEGFTAYQRKMQHEARLKTEFGLSEKLEACGSLSGSAMAGTLAARRKVMSDFDRYVAARPVGKAAPASLTENDEGRVAIEAPPADDPIGDVVTKLEDCLKLLKQMNPDLSADTEDEVEARAALSRGDKATALKRYDSAITALGLKIAAKKNRSALLAQPSSRSRASALIRSGFASQPGVMALDVALGRAPRADFPAPGAAVPPVLPVAPSTPVAPTATSQAGSRDRAREIQAELKSIDAAFRKTGIYSPEAQARSATLRRELKGELRKFHVQ